MQGVSGGLSRVLRSQRAQDVASGAADGSLPRCGAELLCRAWALEAVRSLYGTYDTWGGCCGSRRNVGAPWFGGAGSSADAAPVALLARFPVPLHSLVLQGHGEPREHPRTTRTRQRTRLTAPGGPGGAIPRPAP
ncbi:hypothetical protein SBD_8232 [Streptomyces bottropensis ATCC 25435]|uniref:Uncharacterized protein n=1 Tax=Streptomyces bottropensis ATCC 25435 TaxID=1054862 RepID=M3D3G6_9ACTN|nr:hypothetical protein SBD_8232 [Streptomyces bottropensis ATCC 25435]